MAAAKEVKPDEEVVPNKSGKDLVTDEMKEAAAAQTKAIEARDKDEKARSGVGVLRRRGGSAAGPKLKLSDVPYPAGIHGKDFELYGPGGFAASIPEGTDTAPLSSEQQFVIDPDKVKFLYFDNPGRDLPKKRLYVVKAIHKDGRIVQLGFEDQIQNTAGGDPQDAIGMHRYERKGIYLLLNWETMETVYCGAWGCWAQAAPLGSDFVNFCVLRHAQHTLPNQYKGASAISKGLMEMGVTTTSVWGS